MCDCSNGCKSCSTAICLPRGPKGPGLETVHYNRQRTPGTPAIPGVTLTGTSYTIPAATGNARYEVTYVVDVKVGGGEQIDLQGWVTPSVGVDYQADAQCDRLINAAANSSTIWDVAVNYTIGDKLWYRALTSDSYKVYTALTNNVGVIPTTSIGVDWSVGVDVDRSSFNTTYFISNLLLGDGDTFYMKGVSALTAASPLLNGVIKISKIII